MSTECAHESERQLLGQFIPLHYHHNMLMDENRMSNFKAAIELQVFPGARVLELGGGTGVLSWFAAAKAEKVWCVEYNPEMAEEARRLLARNHNGHKVEVVEADAFSYLPPEPVDVVICEMIHVAMLREKQVEMIESFKRRYLKYFGGPLPVFIPEAAILGVQPLQQEYSFSGFNAPIVQFRDTQFISPGATELAAPAVYRTLDFLQPNDALIKWDGRFKIEQDGAVNALRFITKNILAIDLVSRTTIDWLNHYMVLPLTLPVAVKQGDELRLRFQYRAGGTIPSLIASLRADVARAEAKPTGITKPGRAAKKQPVYS